MGLFSKKSNQNRTLDVTTGPMVGKIFSFAVPIILSGILQQTFNTADSIVVGRWAGSDVLGGVSACSSLINLIICIFTGLAVGSTVTISQSIGARDEFTAGKYAHTSIATAVLGGIFIGVVGVVVSKPVLELMGTPTENIEYSVKYMRIYFCGAPFLLLYNYGSAVLRSIGDTKRPLIYLLIGGVSNVGLNLIMVLGFGMDSDGVAIATIVSNVIASSLVLYSLVHGHHCCRIYPSHIRIYWKEFKRIISLGIPAGIQTGLFSISNVVMQSSINSFGAAYVAGNGAGVSIDTYASYMTDGFSQTAMTFSGQNTGAKKYNRLKNVFLQVNLCCIVAQLLLAAIVIPFRHELVSIFIPNDTVAIEIGSKRLLWTLLPHFIGSLMTVSSSVIRGMGKSITPMLVTVFGVCVLRMIWVATIFEKYNTVNSLYIVYPLTWGITAAAHILFFVWFYKKLKNKGLYSRI